MYLTSKVKKNLTSFFHVPLERPQYSTLRITFVDDFFCVMFLSAIRVRLLVNRQTEEAVAVKVIDTLQAKECAENVKKEICVHKVRCDL